MHKTSSGCASIPVFTARHVCTARTMQDVCLSVCLSHAGIESKRLYVSSKIFHHRVAPPLYFSRTKGWQYSVGDPQNGGVECKGEWKNHDFRPISGFISELMQDRAIVTMEGKLETAPKLSNGTSLIDLEWPLAQISRSRYYSTSNNSKTVKIELYYNGGPIESRMWSIERQHFQWLWTTPNSVFKVTLFFDAAYLWKANRKPHPSFRMVAVWMTFSDLFKVTIIQRQITGKWYNIQL